MKQEMVVSNIRIPKLMKKRVKSSIWDLPKIAKQIKMKPLGLSKEDEEILWNG